MKNHHFEISSNLYGELVIFSGSANPALTASVCDSLGIEPAEASVFQFPNTDTFVQLRSSVRGKDVFLIQPTAAPTNDNLMELLIFVETLRRDSAGRITTVIPYYGYGRTDKKDVPRSPVTARLVADLLMTAGVDRVLTVDLHAAQIMGFFSVPVDEISTMGLLASYFESRQLDLERTTVASPDVGAVRRARDMAEKLHVPLAVIEKRRRHREGQSLLTIIGDVKDRDVIVIDDEIDTAGTMTEAARFLKDFGGARHMFAAAAHGVFSDPARERLEDSPFEEVVVTNTLAIPPERMCSKVRMLNLGEIIAGVISRIHQGRSVGEFLNY